MQTPHWQVWLRKAEVQMISALVTFIIMCLLYVFSALGWGMKSTIFRWIFTYELHYVLLRRTDFLVPQNSEVCRLMREFVINFSALFGFDPRYMATSFLKSRTLLKLMDYRVGFLLRVQVGSFVLLKLSKQLRFMGTPKNCFMPCLQPCSRVK